MPGRQSRAAALRSLGQSQRLHVHHAARVGGEHLAQQHATLEILTFYDGLLAGHGKPARIVNGILPQRKFRQKPIKTLPGDAPTITDVSHGHTWHFHRS
jgi:hypothetical protein